MACMPVDKIVPIDQGIDVWANFGIRYFLERREAGLFNIGGPGHVTVDGRDYALDYKDCLYITRGAREFLFSSGDVTASNKRGINHFLHPDVPKTCQFSMGMTILAPGSMWNSMPTHTHERRMEVYMHFPHLRAAHGREVRGAVRMMFAQTANCKGCAFDHANIGPAKKKTKLTL